MQIPSSFKFSPIKGNQNPINSTNGPKYQQRQFIKQEPNFIQKMSPSMEDQLFENTIINNRQEEENELFLNNYQSIEKSNHKKLNLHLVPGVVG